MRCHAGAGHRGAKPRGAVGELCDECWDWYLRLLDKLLLLDNPLAVYAVDREEPWWTDLGGEA